jgi:hypothetical protein
MILVPGQCFCFSSAYYQHDGWVELAFAHGLIVPLSPRLSVPVTGDSRDRLARKHHVSSRLRQSCQRPELVGSFAAFGASSWTKNAVVAGDCTLTAEPDPDGHEDLRTVLVPVDQLRDELRSGAMVGTGTPTSLSTTPASCDQW